MLHITGEGRKAQIIDEATRLFSRDGFDKITVKQLADACQITEPAIYRHFPSKEAIYDAVLDALKDRMNTGPLFAELEDEQDVEMLLRKLATHIITFFTDHHDIYRLLLYSTLQEHAHARETFGLIRGTYVRFLLTQFERLYAAGIIKPANVEISARCFVGSVFDCALSGTLWRGMLGRTYQPGEVIANNVPIFARGLRAQSS